MLPGRRDTRQRWPRRRMRAALYVLAVLAACRKGQAIVTKTYELPSSVLSIDVAPNIDKATLELLWEVKTDSQASRARLVVTGPDTLKLDDSIALDTETQSAGLVKLTYTCPTAPMASAASASHVPTSNVPVAFGAVLLAALIPEARHPIGAVSGALALALISTQTVVRVRVNSGSALYAQGGAQHGRL